MSKYNVFVAASSNSQNQASIGVHTAAISNYVGPKLPNTTIQDVAAGSVHTLFLMDNGHVYACGSNSFGQLGDGTTISKNIAILAFSGQTSTCVSIAAGRNTSYAITQDGKLYAWGANNYGQLGVGDGVDRTTPTRVGTASNWVKVVTANGNSAYHILALNSAGEIYACGLNTSGQLGQGNTTNLNALTRIGTASDWIDIAVNEVASYAVKSDGTVWACGGDSLGSQGNGSTLTSNVLTLTQISSLSNITKVFTCNNGLAAALNSSNQLYVWGGSNSSGVLRTGTSTISTPTLISGTWKFFTANTIFSIAISTNGDVYGAGSTSAIPTLGRGPSGVGSLTSSIPFNDIKNAHKASISDAMSFVLVQPTQKLLYSTGKDTSTPSNTTITTPLYYAYPWAYIPDNNIKGFVTNKINDAGYNLSTNFKILLTDNNELYGWGTNTYGVFGDYGYDNVGQVYSSIHKRQFSNSYYNFTSESWAKIAAGHGHAAYLSIDGTLILAGTQYFGSLGFNTLDGSTLVNASISTLFNDVSCGDFFTILVGANNRLYGLGINNYGQVGIGNTTSSISALTQCSSSVLFSKVSCGLSFTLALSLNGDVYSWGRNVYGQLGLGNTNDISVPTLISSNGSNVVDIACGNNHAIVLKSNGTLWGCGLNNVGQLGTGTTTSSFTTLVQITNNTNWVRIFAFADNTVAINSLGEIYICGSNANGQIATGSNSPLLYRTLTKISQISLPNPTVNSAIFTGTPDSWFGTAYADENIPLTTTTTTTVGPGSTTTTTVGPGTTTTVGPGTTTTTTVSPSKPPYAYVSNNNSNTISVIELSTGNLYTTINVGPSPLRSFIDSDGNTAYVIQNPTSGDSSLCIINTSNSSVRTTINLPSGFEATWISVDSVNKKAYITSDTSTSILVLNTITDTLDEVITYPIAIRSTLIDTANGIMYCTENPSNSVGVFNLSSKTRTAVIPVGGFPYGLALNSSTNRLYVSNFNSNNITIVNTTNNSIVSTISSGSKPIQLAINPSTQRLYAVNLLENGTVTVINTNDNSIVNTINVGRYPQSIAVDSVYNKAIVTSGEDDQVKILNLSNNTVAGTLNVGDGPLYVSIGGILISATTTSTTTTTTGTPATTTTTTVDPSSLCKPNKQFLRIQIRRGTSTEFTSSNIVLASGEPAYAIDTNILKIGDGVSGWTALDPIGANVENETDVYVELENILIGGDRISFDYDNINKRIAINAALEPQVFDRGDFTLSTNQNNLNVGTKAVVKLIPSASINISGLLAGQDNEMKLIYNGGTNNITFLHNSTSSSVGNRLFIYTKQNFVLLPDHGVTVIYDNSIQSWRLF